MANRNFHSPVLLAACVALTACNQSGPCEASEIKIVAPNALADVEADALIAPLPETFRVQYFYEASQFSSLPAQHNVMTQLSWRPDGAQEGPIAFTSDRLIMRLSTTTKTLDNIDAVLDNNVTSEPVVVYDGPWNVTSQNTGPAGGPKDFDYTVEFQQPFVYDPAQGNLLVEHTILGSSADFFGDFSVSLDVPSRAIWTGEDVNSPTSTGDIWGGAVIELTFVPEPSSAMLLIGLAIGVLAMRRRLSLKPHAEIPAHD